MRPCTTYDFRVGKPYHNLGMLYIFLIWKSDQESLINFINYLNNVVPSIKVTHEIVLNPNPNRPKG